MRLLGVVTGLVALTLLAATAFPAGAATSVNIKTRKIIVFKDAVSEQVATEVLEDAGDLDVQVDFDVVNGAAVTADAAAIQSLTSNPSVERIEDDVVIMAVSHRSAPAQTLPWGIDRIGANDAWPTGTGRGQQVAILDTGADLDHPDLVANLRSGVNFVSPGRPPEDDNGHGSHVAGIVAATNNTFGAVGVAPEAEIYPVKILNRRGAGYLSDIIAGLDWAIANGMDVANMSLGTSLDLLSFREAVQRATAAGITVVAAAGNTRGGPVLYPAAYPEVIAIGALDDNGQSVYRYSSVGPQLALVAPGERILSTYEKGRYKSMTGTSMASPHVAGVAALIRATPNVCDFNHDGGCDPAEVRTRLIETADDIGLPGRDDTSGYGIVNALRALSSDEHIQ